MQDIPESPRRYKAPTRNVYLAQIEAKARRDEEEIWTRQQESHSHAEERIRDKVSLAAADFDRSIELYFAALAPFFKDETLRRAEFESRNNTATQYFMGQLRDNGYQCEGLLGTSDSIVVYRVPVDE